MQNSQGCSHYDVETLMDYTAQTVKRQRLSKVGLTVFWENREETEVPQLHKAKDSVKSLGNHGNYLTDGK